MTLPNELHPGFFSAAGGGGFTIDQSLRFKGSTLDFQYTPSTTGDRRKWTWATWVKRANMTGTHGLLGVSAGASDTQQTEIRIQSTGMLALMGYSTTFRQTQARLRDPSAWYHIVVVLDITNSTANDRIKFYINGQKVTDWDAISNPATSDEFAINYADNTRLGLRANGSDRLDGYLAETYFLDGIAVTDTGGVIDEFGEYNTYGIWVPKAYTGSFGPNNGYHLKYDSSGYSGSGGIGADHSGSGNNFTATNFDTTAISSSNFDNDIDYFDTPTSNYATLNAALGPENQTLSNANLSGAGNSTKTSLTTQLPNYKYYWEGIGSNYYHGISEINAVRDTYLGNRSDEVGWFRDGNFWVGASNVGAFGPSFTTTDIAMLAYDPASGKLWVGINGTWHGSGDPANGTNPAYTVGASIRETMLPASNVSANTVSYNFGQRPFIYTVPTGFKALQSNNLTEPTIKNGRDHFHPLIWTGDNVTPKTRTGLNFKPDLVWIKERNQAYSIGHRLYDSVRGAGVNKHLDSDTNDAEGTGNDEDYGYVTGFVEGGFTTINGGSGGDYVNSSSNNYVAWCWKAGGTAVLNQNGNIDTQVSANTAAGFSIISFTGNETASTTIGHGLTQAPEFVITKKRDSAGNWNTYHASAGSTKYLALNLSDMAFTDASMYNGTTSTVVNIGHYNAINANNEGMIMYAWHSVENYSKFGGYTGNGNGTSPNSDGPYIHLGFKPALVIIKRTDTNSGGEWSLYDSSRSPINANRAVLSANNDTIETTMDGLDLLSNGFKVRGGGGTWVNVSGGTYVYAAWAELPFGGENTTPVTAR